MKKFLLSFILLAVLGVTNAQAATYYVRTDGGTSSQCNGTTNSAYDGSGGPDNCAFIHPFYATGWWGDGSTSSGGQAPVMTTGDDLVISCNDTGDCTGVTFNMGFTSTWSGMNSAWSYGGFMRPIVDGNSGNHTTIKGCSSSGCSDASRRPGFTGKGGNYMNINLQGSDYVDIEDIDSYDTGSYGYGHATYDANRQASTSNSVRDNVTVIGATNVTLTDMKLWGAYRYGVFGGSVSNIIFDNVDISYNAFGGWDGDNCGGAGNCGASGTITFRNHSRITYNGCVASTTYGTIASNGCYSQDQTGYGDGLGFGDTGAAWVFTDTEISHNVSDGLDLLYCNRGSYAGLCSVSIKRGLFEGNAGNNVKVPNNTTAEDTVNIGNCGYFYGQAFTCSSGTCGASFNHCRASGNNWVFNFFSGDTNNPSIINSTTLSNADVALQTGGTCSGRSVIDRNNIWIGGREFLDDTSINGAGGNDSTSIFYNADGTCTATRTETNNFCYLFKEGTNSCNGSGSVDGTSVPANFFDGTLLQGPISGVGYYTGNDYITQIYLHASSIARDTADETVSGADSVDYNNFDRGASWDTGALEYGSVPSGGGGGGETPTPQPWYGSFVNGTLY